MTDRSKYVNAVGNRYTKAIFYEMTMADKGTVLFSLKDRDHKGFPSLYRLYMDHDDLTEYDFAMTHLDGWEHWKLLCDCTWFKPFVSRWREELHLRHAATALRQVKRIAGANENGSMAANKYLLEKGWQKNMDPVGRPTKDAIKRKAKEMVLTEEEIAEDHKRIFN
jgi:hypothetical protein